MIDPSLVALQLKENETAVLRGAQLFEMILVYFSSLKIYATTFLKIVNKCIMSLIGKNVVLD